MKKPECEIDSSGTKRWRLNGKLHREDGPAVEFTNGGKRWYLNNKLHREDGPAIEWAGGDKQWWLNGTYYCFSWDSLHGFTKGFVRWIEDTKKLQGKK